MRSPSAPSPSHPKALWAYGLLLGIVCFSAGRLSVSHPDLDRSVASSHSGPRAPTEHQAQANFTIKQIEVSHVGPPAVSDALIRANIRVKVGETLLASF